MSVNKPSGIVLYLSGRVLPGGLADCFRPRRGLLDARTITTYRRLLCRAWEGHE